MISEFIFFGTLALGSILTTRMTFQNAGEWIKKSSWCQWPNSVTRRCLLSLNFGLLGTVRCRIFHSHLVHQQKNMWLDWSSTCLHPAGIWRSFEGLGFRGLFPDLDQRHGFYITWRHHAVWDCRSQAVWMPQLQPPAWKKMEMRTTKNTPWLWKKNRPGHACSLTLTCTNVRMVLNRTAFSMSLQIGISLCFCVSTWSCLVEILQTPSTNLFDLLHPQWMECGFTCRS